jgi:nitroimidazol reductase NimA-like FMN-containing flavoprotein (pyridoxamine 5'-phosphate oxidase superfamily)
MERMTTTADTAKDLPESGDLEVHRYKQLQRWASRDLFDVLDAGLIAHVGFVRDGKPAVIPMAYAFNDDAILMHGSTGAGLNKAAKRGVDLAVTISVFDGLVYAQSLFDSTVNYRCAVILGTAEPVPNEDKEAAVKEISHRLTPGRWDEVRPPTPRELAATYVLRMALDQASVKIRSGHPDDDPESGIWTGYLPFQTIVGDPVAQDGVDCPVTPAVHDAKAQWARRLS